MNAISILGVPDSPQNLETGCHLLIADDEARFRTAYKTLLAHEQRVIEEAENGKEALSKLKEGKIDLVILDLKLPDISGLEIMEWLTANKINTTVIVFSADKSINSAIHALRYRAFEFLRKDCDPDDMLLAVERALNFRFGAAVERGGCFVQYQDGRIFEQCAGNGDALFLAAG